MTAPLAATGGVTIYLDGAPLTFVLDFNAMCEFEARYEAELGVNALEAIARVEAGSASMRILRGLIWAGLQQHHPDASEMLAGRVMQTGLAQIKRAIDAALPDVGDAESPAPEDDAGAAENPPAAAAG